MVFKQEKCYANPKKFREDHEALNSVVACIHYQSNIQMDLFLLGDCLLNGQLRQKDDVVSGRGFCLEERLSLLALRCVVSSGSLTPLIAA